MIAAWAAGAAASICHAGVILITLRGGAGTHGEQQGGENEASVMEQAKLFAHNRIFPLRGRRVPLVFLICAG